MFFNNLLYLIYPKVCVLCGKKINENKTYACEKCFNIIKYKMNEVILKKIPGVYFDSLISLFLYKGVIRKKILEFKFRNKPYLGILFGEIMAKVFLQNSIMVDAIIPVPMHYIRFLNRGYNQSVILAKEVSKVSGVKLYKNVLRKTKKSEVQSTLNLEQRRKNILNTYSVKNKSRVFSKNVLLIDDIYTTGSTVNECSKVLKENGVNKVFVLTIAHGEFK